MLLQERRLIGRQLIPGEGGVDHALLEDIEHIADEGGESQPFSGLVGQRLFGILQRAVIAGELVVDGVGQGETLHFLPACVVQGGGIDDPGGPTVAVAQRVSN